MLPDWLALLLGISAIVAAAYLLFVVLFPERF